MKKVLVLGAGGFIGSHLVDSLKSKGHYVIGADLKYPEFQKSSADEFHLVDLCDQLAVNSIVTNDVFEIYQLAADMGGAGYIFTGLHDSDITRNNVSINVNVLNAMLGASVKRIFLVAVHVSIRHIIKQILQTPIARSRLRTQQTQIVNTAGKSYSVKDCFYLMQKIITLGYVLPDCTISLGHKVHGIPTGQKRQRHYARKLP